MRTPIHSRRRSCLAMLSLLLTAGCSSLHQPDLAKLSSLFNEEKPKRSADDPATNAKPDANVSNPPAKHIRFEGQEALLGGGEFQAVRPTRLHQSINDLLAEHRYRTAALMVNMHSRSARRLLIEKSSASHGAELDFIAKALDDGAQHSHWSVHLERCRQPETEIPDFTPRPSQHPDSLGPRSNDDAFALIHQQASAAKATGSVPLSIQAERLLAATEISQGQLPEGLERLASVAEYATQAGMAASASELWLMAAETSLRLERVDQARRCWQAALATQLAAIRNRDATQAVPAIDAAFWEQADRLRHPEDAWPAEIKLAFSPWLRKIGITEHEALAPHVTLWAAVTEYQLAIGQPHLALLAVKRAETEAPEGAKPWLTIASARALAAQGQIPVATTILTQVSQSTDDVIRGAALATLGTIKIHSGAYEQGSQFLADGLNAPGISRWPGHLAARADFVLAALIMGETEEILPKLHEIQNELLIANQWQSLVRSLENEAAIMLHEKNEKSASTIRQRIRDIENDPS